ncbi:MAG: D-sedoheptulose-7-phosphate isomerase [Nakamurella sp.]
MTRSITSGGSSTVRSEHVASLHSALADFDVAAERSQRWGRFLADALLGGARLLVAGNGGSAAQAQHLSAEVVGRYREDRPAFSAVSLHSEPCALTAIVNDYGIDEMFARQVSAHGRKGDILVLMSTSGRSANLIVAAERAKGLGIHTWAMTGCLPNPLAAACDENVAIPSQRAATVQELHLVSLHLICEAMDEALADRGIG